MTKNLMILSAVSLAAGLVSSAYADLSSKSVQIDCSESGIQISALENSSSNQSDVYLGIDYDNNVAHTVKKSCTLGSSRFDIEVDYSTGSGHGYCGSDPAPQISLSVDGSPIDLGTTSFNDTCNDQVPTISNVSVDASTKTVTVSTALASVPLPAKVIDLSKVMASSAAQLGAGSGGMAECVSLSVNAALKDYGLHHALFPLPSIVVSKSDVSPSNGIDVKINVNNSMIYYVSAQPNGGGPGSALLGCTNARILKVSPIGG